MNNTDIKSALDALAQISLELEDKFIESEGECTEETDYLEEEQTAIQLLLTTEGVDSLGRWLKSKEDEKKSLKAEKDYISRRINAVDNTIDYIKGQIYIVMNATGMEKIKGSNGYTFTPTISETTSVDKEVLKTSYSERVEKAIREANIPDYIGVSLTASSSVAKEKGVNEGDENLFIVTSRPTAKFTKPRGSKTSE